MKIEEKRKTGVFVSICGFGMGNYKDSKMEKIADINKITDMGVMITPALAVDGVVKIAGKLPTVDALKELLK